MEIRKTRVFHGVEEGIGDQEDASFQHCITNLIPILPDILGHFLSGSRDILIERLVYTHPNVFERRFNERLAQFIGLLVT